MALKTKLAILRDENLDHFLNASLASLRLIQNILEYPKADRYRMIRSDAPVLKHPGVKEILEVIGFHFEEHLCGQFALSKEFVQSKDLRLYLQSCKDEILATRRRTGLRMAWEIPENSLHIRAMTGVTESGEVFNGILDSKDVTIKVLHKIEDQKLREQFVAEIDMLRELKHSNVVELLGIIITAEPPSMVLDGISENLLNLLHSQQLPASKSLSYLKQVVTGMAYIHEKGIIHSNLRAQNLHLDSYDTVKIANFSESKREKDLESISVSLTKTAVDFNIRWKAPEVISQQKWSKMADVWSFGVVFYEFITNGSLPYGNYTNEQVAEMVANGYQLPCPQYCKESFYSLIKECWSSKPDERPSFNDLSEMNFKSLDQISESPITSRKNSSTTCAVEEQNFTNSPKPTKKSKKGKGASLNTILNKSGNLLRVYTGLLSHSKHTIVIGCLPKTTVHEVIETVLTECGKRDAIEAKNCRLVAMAFSNPVKKAAHILKAEDSCLTAMKKLGIEYQFILYICGTSPPSDVAIIAAVLEAKTNSSLSAMFDRRVHGYLILNEEVDFELGNRQVICGWKKLWCVIHHGTMFLYKNKEDELLGGYWKQLPLFDCRIEMIYETKKKIAGFALFLSSGHEFTFSTVVTNEVEIIDWIEAVSTGRHLSASPLTRDSAGGEIIHAGSLQFQQYLDVKKTKPEVLFKIQCHQQREKSADRGAVEEGSVWIALRNTGILERIYLENGSGSESKEMLQPEEWINLLEVSSVAFSDFESVSVLGHTIELCVPPSRFIINPESLADHCRWVNAIKSILIKNDLSSCITNSLTPVRPDFFASKPKEMSVSARAMFRRNSINLHSTYYVEPDEAFDSDTEDSLGEAPKSQHRGSGASSVDSGVVADRRESDYLEILAPEAAVRRSNAILRKKVVLPPLDVCPNSPTHSESSIYCDINSPRHSSHVYASISDFTQTLALCPEECPMELEESKETDFDKVKNILCHSTSSDGTESSQSDSESTPDKFPLVGDLPQSYVELATIKDRKRCTSVHSLEENATSDTKSDSDQMLIQRGRITRSLSSTAVPYTRRSLVTDDDYIPMQSACLKSREDITATTSPAKEHFEFSFSQSQGNLTVPEESSSKQPLAEAPREPPPPLPPRNYKSKGASSHDSSLKTRSLPTNVSASVVGNFVQSSEDSSLPTRKGSFRKNLKHLLGNIIHPNTRTDQEPVDKERKVLNVYKTAQVFDLDGMIGLGSGSPRTRRKKEPSYSSCAESVQKGNNASNTKLAESSSTLLIHKRGGVQGNVKPRPLLRHFFPDEMSDIPRSSSIQNLSIMKEFESHKKEGLHLPLSSSLSLGRQSSKLNSKSHSNLTRSFSTCHYREEEKEVSTTTLRHTHSLPHCSIASVSHNPLTQRNIEEIHKGMRSLSASSQKEQQTKQNSQERHCRASPFTSSQPQHNDSQTQEDNPINQDLPPGWKETVDEASGRLYYYNPDTGKNTWNRKEVLQLATVNTLPPGRGWKIVELSDGRKYFYHIESRLCTWNIMDTWMKQDS